MAHRPLQIGELGVRPVDIDQPSTEGKNEQGMHVSFFQWERRALSLPRLEASN